MSEHCIWNSHKERDSGHVNKPYMKYKGVIGKTADTVTVKDFSKIESCLIGPF